EHAVEVDRQHLRPISRGEVEKAVPDADAGVVDQDVDAAELAVDGREGRRNLPRICHVDDDGVHQRRKFPGELMAAFRIAVEDQDPGLFLKEAFDRRETDPTGTARDDDSLPLESSHDRMIAAPPWVT